MTGKVFNSGATGALILILPIALAIIVILNTWPALLALIILGICWNIWQNYHWKKWSSQVNPFFHQLIQENQGCLTPLDLSLKANLTGTAARRFLERKAQEYGAQSKVYEDKGTVYYFLTASALGRIFEDSDPFEDLDKDDEPSNSESPKLVQASSQFDIFSESSTKEQLYEEEEVQETFASGISQLVKLEDDPPLTESGIGVIFEEEPEPEESDSSIPQSSIEESEIEENNSSTTGTPLIQSELAKRLDINPSTVGRHKSDPDFPEWSKTRDPDGIAWQYSPKTKMFVPLVVHQD